MFPYCVTFFPMSRTKAIPAVSVMSTASSLEVLENRSKEFVTYRAAAALDAGKGYRHTRSWIEREQHINSFPALRRCDQVVRLLHKIRSMDTT